MSFKDNFFKARLDLHFVIYFTRARSHRWTVRSHKKVPHLPVTNPLPAINQGFPQSPPRVQWFARMAHTTQEHYKGYNSGTIKWKRCTGQGMGEEHAAKLSNPSRCTIPTPGRIHQPSKIPFLSHQFRLACSHLYPRVLTNHLSIKT